MAVIYIYSIICRPILKFNDLILKGTTVSKASSLGGSSKFGNLLHDK